MNRACGESGRYFEIFLESVRASSRCALVVADLQLRAPNNTREFGIVPHVDC